MSALRFAIVGVVLISFTACTTLQPLEDFSPSKIREEVHVGDRASIVWSDHLRYDIRVTAVDAEAVHGVADSGKAYKFPFEGIRSIDVEQSSWSRTAVVAVGVAVVAFIVLLLRSLRWESGGGGEHSSSSGSEG